MSSRYKVAQWRYGKKYRFRGTILERNPRRKRCEQVRLLPVPRVIVGVAYMVT